MYLLGAIEDLGALGLLPLIGVVAIAVFACLMAWVLRIAWQERSRS